MYDSCSSNCLPMKISAKSKKSARRCPFTIVLRRFGAPPCAKTERLCTVGAQVFFHQQTYLLINFGLVSQARRKPPTRFSSTKLKGLLPTLGSGPKAFIAPGRSSQPFLKLIFGVGWLHRGDHPPPLPLLVSSYCRSCTFFISLGSSPHQNILMN